MEEFFVQIGNTNRDKRSFSPGWCYQPGQKGHPLVRAGVTNRDKRVGPFIPDGATNRVKKWFLSRVQRLAGPAGGTGAFCPGWRHQPGQKRDLLSRLVSPTWTKLLGPLIPFPLPPPEPFRSLVPAVLGSRDGSSCLFLHHICEDL